MKENIVGSEKVSQDPTAMKHFITKEVLLDPKEIQKASLEYCTNLLKSKDPK